MLNVPTNLWRFDRLLLAAYLVALLGLLLLPIPGQSRVFLGIGADKWMHVVLFGGLAVFLRWNLSASRAAEWSSIGIALVVAIATELAQGLVAFRSADLWDVVAGLLGAVLGTFGMSEIMSSLVPERSVGLLISILGLTICALFVFADVIGMGGNPSFGLLQLMGTGLGCILIAGGVGIYLRGRRSDMSA